MKKIWQVLVILTLTWINGAQAADLRSPHKDLAVDVAADRLHFVMEKVTSENIEFWEDYKNAMLRIASQLDISLPMKKDYALAIKGFTNALDAFKEVKGKSQLWIAYLTPDPTATGYSKMAQIEICVTVTTSETLPIVTHMGIFKSPIYLASAALIKNAGTIPAFADFGIRKIMKVVRGLTLTKHSNLSLLLHTLAAHKMLEIYPKKTHMVTAPLDVMGDILKKVFGSHAKRIDGVITITHEHGVSIGSHQLTSDRKSTLLKSDHETVVELPGDAANEIPWLDKIIFLSNPHTNKVAIPLKILAAGPAVAKPKEGELQEHKKGVEEHKSTGRL